MSQHMPTEIIEMREQDEEPEIKDDDDSVHKKELEPLEAHCYIGPNVKVEKSSKSYFCMKFFLNVVAVCCGCCIKKKRNKI